MNIPKYIFESWDDSVCLFEDGSGIEMVYKSIVSEGIDIQITYMRSQESLRS